ncbi:MAG: hypothetical protein JO107_16615 [Hyphomicrobiales bacterium]|nr:hypothetical protein [Hyphomicrobiales bacterium]MBV8664712.1 hypothetical protein [Hyphomicrobiales bacterium]
MSRAIEGTTAGGYLCDAVGCDMIATHSPMLCVPFEGYPVEIRPPLVAFCDVHVCPVHWQGLRSSDFVSKAMTDVIEATAAESNGRPAFKRAYVKPIVCHSYEYLQFQQKAGLVAPDDAIAKGSITAPI